MIWVYRLAFIPLFVLAMPYYAYRMWRRGGYRADFSQRFGSFPNLPAKRTNAHRVWIQAVSVGEVMAIEPVVTRLLASSQFEVIITTTTSTGYRQAKVRYADHVLAVGLFPFDFLLFSKRAHGRIRPDVIIQTESELWPEHLHQARKRDLPTFLINARISERSFRRYRKVRPLSRWLFAKVSDIFPASPLDRERLEAITENPSQIRSTGSIKFDVSTPPLLNAEEKRERICQLGLYAENQQGSLPVIILGSSTWPGEERMLINTTAKLLEAGYDCRLILIPRHAERRDEVVSILKQQPLAWAVRSLKHRTDQNTRIYLADTTGELFHFTQIADIAFIGKSMVGNKGGQTPIEGAALSIPMLCGPNMDNFSHIIASLKDHDGIVEVSAEAAFEGALTQLVKDRKRRQTLGSNAKNWHASMQGSSQKIVEAIMNICGNGDQTRSE